MVDDSTVRLNRFDGPKTFYQSEDERTEADRTEDNRTINDRFKDDETKDIRKAASSLRTNTCIEDDALGGPAISVRMARGILSSRKDRESSIIVFIRQWILSTNRPLLTNLYN